jgi:hypothetical protein
MIAEGDEWHAHRADGLSGPGTQTRSFLAALALPEPLRPSAGPLGRRHSSPSLGLFGSGPRDLCDPCVE